MGDTDADDLVPTDMRKQGTDTENLLANLQVKQVCSDHKLAAVTVALLGSGVMEWSRERDHRVNISSGRKRKL